MAQSEDEYAVINEVDILVTKMKARAEIHFDTRIDTDIRKRIRANESLDSEVRIKKMAIQSNQHSKIAECHD